MRQKKKEARPQSQWSLNKTLDSPSSSNGCVKQDINQGTELLQEHNYFKPPEALKDEISSKDEKIKKLEREVALLKKRNKRAKAKIESFKGLVKHLHEKDLIAESVTELLSQKGSKVPKQIFTRLLDSKTNKKRRKFYTKELKAFAITLNYYSSKAYNYVRDVFGLALPHESVLRRWYNSISAEPGFTERSFDTLKIKVEEERKAGKEVIVSLVFDEIAIKKKFEFDGKKFHGSVDLGPDVPNNDTSTPAVEGLVMMVVSLNASWKLPVAYFLIDHLSAEKKANLIVTCLTKLGAIGVRTANVTCDCPSTNFAVMKLLGAVFDENNLQTTFPHPNIPDWHVAVVFDPCHLLKLVRNAFSHLQVLVDKDGNEVKWNYIKSLHKLQQETGLRAGNKLRQDHIDWHKQKMKVNLAAQTLSTSVADAIDCCREELNLPEFQDSKPTTDFIRIIDALFDVMNSRNIFGRFSKSPMKESNRSEWSQLFEKAQDYISSMKDLKGCKMIHTPRKAGFLGFLINMKSFGHLFENLVSSKKMDYLLTYKTSQDHVELFFCALRSRRGLNNNPTAREFFSSYRRLLLHNEIRGNGGNCLLQDDTSILSLPPSKKKISPFDPGQHIDFSISKRYRLTEENYEHDYATVNFLPDASEFKEAIIEYISGFIVRRVSSLLRCPDCLDSVIETDDSTHYKLVDTKNRGGLVKANRSVKKVCEESEIQIMRLIAMNSSIPSGNQMIEALVFAIFKSVTEKFS